MKKILILSWHPDDSSIMFAGGFKRVFEIVKRVPSDIQITCIDKYPSFFAPLASKIDIDTYTVPSFIRKITKTNFVIGKGLEKIYISMFLVVLICRKYRDYIIYVPFSELTQLSLPAVIIKFLTRQRVVFTNLNVNHFFPENILNPTIHSFADKVITISKSLKNDLEKEKIYPSSVNPVGVDLTIADSIKIQKKIYDGIFVGRHTPEKGIFDAIKICALLNKSDPFKLICLGDIPDNYASKIKKLTNELKQEKNIYFMGKVTEEEKIKYLKQSKICLFTSHQEGWGIVPMEALVSRIPVVAYNLEVYKENIASCPAVSLVEKFEKNTFALAVSRVLESLYKDQDLHEARLKGSIIELKRFSWDKIAEEEFKLIS